MRQRRLRTVVLGTGAFLLFATALIGVAHLPAARPVLARLGRLLPGSSCPLGFGVQQPLSEKEAFQRRFATLHAGSNPAIGRPALGFDLDRATRAEVLAWGASHGGDCHPSNFRGDVECTKLTAQALPKPSSAVPVAQSLVFWFTFGAGDRLTILNVSRNLPTAALASAVFEEEITTLTEGAGAPAALDAQRSAAKLGAGLLSQEVAEFRFSDFYAVLRATNQGDHFTVTEEFHALPATSTETAAR